MKPTIPLHKWSAGRYQSASSHDDNVEPFLARQRARIAEAARHAQGAEVVTPIKQRKAGK